MDDIKTWQLIHEERAAIADTLASLTSSQWAEPSLCGTWSVQVAAGHILAGAEQTRANFMKRMLANGFRFNTMMDRDARRMGTLPPSEIITRLPRDHDHHQPTTGTGDDDARRDRRARP